MKKSEPQNVTMKFFITIGNGIKWFLWAIITFIKNLILAILEIIRDVFFTIAKFLYHVRNSILWIWLLILSTVLISVISIWVLSASVKNLDESSIGKKYFEKMEFLIDLHAEKIKKDLMESLIETETTN
jgi:hypothetical protein